MAFFTPENELETLLLAAYADPGRRPAFFRRFLDSTIYVMDDPAPNGKVGKTPGVRMLDVKGIAHVPAFSSIERAREFGKLDASYHEVKTRALLEAVSDRPLILNPGSSPVKLFSREEIAALLDGTLLVDY